jgi:hypothetical protein
MAYIEDTIKDIPEMIVKLKKYFKLKDAVWYRGHSDKKWKLLPSLSRKKGSVDAELMMIKRFKQNALPFSMSRPTTEAEWLFLMQHHGVPTRLLDWTESPLIALYFSVCEHPKKDGALWTLLPTKLNSFANIDYKFSLEIPCFDHDKTLESYLPSVLASERTSNLNPLAAIALRSNPRIYAQLGTFTITHRLQKPIEDVGDQKHVIKLIIPASRKSIIKEQLSYFKINKLTLFPELDNVALLAKEVIK